MSSEILFTWLDIQFVLDELRAKNQLPEWLVRFTVYQDDLVLEVTPNTSPQDVKQFLNRTFRARMVDGETIALESSPTKQRLMAVTTEEYEGEESRPVRSEFSPSFRRVVALPEEGGSVSAPEPLPKGGPEVIAFYSFKGGVGRTTHLLAYLKAITERPTPTRALVVDADLEAPGITALIRNESSIPAANFSFVDLLALIQSDASENSVESLDLASYMAARQSFSISSKEAIVDHYFIPAFRSEEQAMRLEIRPEHISSRPGKAWFLTDFFSELAARLSVDVVLIDLRAGYSELSSPFLFDPRIRRMIVTTPAAQSILGTASVLRQLRKISSALGWERSLDPSVVLSFVLPELANSQFENDAITKIAQSYPMPASDDSESELQITTTPFAQELLYLDSMNQAMARLDSSALVKRMSELAEVDLPPKKIGLPHGELQLDQIRERLSSLAEKLEYAESGKGDEFLRIAPLRALARQYSSTPPVAVVIGAKGSGKTYTYLQILRARSWGAFVGQIVGEQRTNGGVLWPLLSSVNLNPLAQSLVDAARADAQIVVGAHQPITSSQIGDEVKIALRVSDADEVWWRHKWFEIIAKSLLRISTATNAYASELIYRLRETGKQVVVMIDGLEDLFSDLSNNRDEQVALRALVQGVPNYLREVPDNPLGLLIFVRADLARAAIAQNYGQFSRLYDAFALQWNEEEALRLAVWMAQLAEMPTDLPSHKQPELLSLDEAKDALIPLWGPKLGSERSREARSAEWVIAALSDFKGQIQARDLVRFLRYAAKESIGGSSQDRVLVPTAVRNAIRQCGVAKIGESVQEIPQLKSIFEKLRAVDDLRIPFDAVRAQLNSEDIRFLQSVGMLAELNGEYYMPEIYRFGLGIRLSEGARPKVLSLARRARSE